MRFNKLFYLENNLKFNLTTNTIKKINFKKTLYVEGHFESENYFSFLANDLKSSLVVDQYLVNKNCRLINSIKDTNSISIHIIRHRFSEEKNNSNKDNILKSEEFTKSIISYVHRAVDFFKKNTKNPKFFIWSNDFSDLDIHFQTENFEFVKNNNLATDFYLFSLSKHFIVGPSTFHWWGAWLNNSQNKICLRPKEIFLNPSNNDNFWPKSWIKI